MKNKAKLLLVPMMLLSLGGCKNVNSKVNGEEHLIVDNLSAGQINLVRKASGLTQDGYEYIDLEYTILPENASNKSIFTTFSWVDSNVQDSIESYLGSTIDETNSTIRVIAYEAFNHQARMKITSVANRDAYASITIDYARRPLRVDVTDFDTKINTIINAGEDLTNYRHWYGLDEYGKSVSAFSESTLGGTAQTTTVIDTHWFNMNCFNLVYSDGTLILDQDTIDDYNSDVEWTLTSASTQIAGISASWTPSRQFSTLQNTTANNKVKSFFVDFMEDHWDDDIKIAELASACYSYASTYLTSAESAAVSSQNYIGTVVDVTVAYSITLKSGRVLTNNVTHHYPIIVPGGWFYVNVNTLSSNVSDLQF